MKIGIIGTGVYSTAIALTLASNKDNKIVMWSENKSLVEEYKKSKKLNKFFKEKTIPKNITITNEYEECLDDAAIVFLITGVNYLEGVCKEIRSLIRPEIPVCIGTKGIAEGSKKFVHQIVQKYLKNKVAILSGPTFAIDVANLEPVGFTLACKDKKTRKILKNVLDFEDVRIEETKDMTGTAICGCIKNIYAIGSGIINGLGYNESTKALYLVSVYEELGNILYRFKSTLEMQTGLAGLGDLVLTCSSDKSRNYRYGEMLSKKGSQKEAKKYREQNTVEGINTLNTFAPICKRKHIKCPILYTIYDILNNNEKPNKLIECIIKKND